MTDIYLDNHATTRPDPAVVEAMRPYFEDCYGNASSDTHDFGRRAKQAVDAAREQVASLIGAHPTEIVFTSGATEAANLAILGSVPPDGKRHIVISSVEHPCVLETCRALAVRKVATLTEVPPESDGVMNSDKLHAAVTRDTWLMCVMAANNEIGTIQPLADIFSPSRQYLSFCDAAQAVGKTPIDVDSLGIDLLALSGHKIYGPKGVGALFVRRRPRRVALKAITYGGGQERGLRPGTLPVPLIVGFGQACEIARAQLAQEGGRIRVLRERLWSQLQRGVRDIRLNGDADRRLPGNLNFMVPGVNARALVSSVKALAVSTGAACSSGSREPSHVLRAIGLSDEDAACSVRIGLGRFNSTDDVDHAARYIVDAVEQLRAIHYSVDSEKLV